MFPTSNSSFIVVPVIKIVAAPSDASMEAEGVGGDGEAESERDKYDIIHRKREMVKNYGKRMFRRVKRA